jgi:S1-C subfamily serine protease
MSKRSTFRNRLAALALAGLLGTPLALVAADAPKAGKPYLGIAVAQADEGGPSGVQVRDVNPTGPGAKGGLKTDDRIVKAGDKPVKSFEDLQTVLAGHKPGDKLTITVVRDGKEQAVTVTLGEPVHRDGSPAAPKARAFLGVQSQPLTAEMKEHLKVNADKGALVTSVVPDSPAAAAGLAEEDVITHLGDAAVNTPEDLRRAVEKAGTGKEVTLKLVRGQRPMELKVRLGEAPGVPTAGPRWFREMPEGLDRLPPGRLPPCFSGANKVQELQKKVDELEKRVQELEQQLKNKTR